MQTNTSLSVGDEVVIRVLDVVKQMQIDHGGWNDAMEECLVGPCEIRRHNGVDTVVKAPSGRVYRLNSKLLSKYKQDEENRSRYAVGDTVKVIDEKNKVKELQKGHGEWEEWMTLILKKKGLVKSIHPNGDLQVEIKDFEIRLNPECVVKPKSFLTEMQKMMKLKRDDETVCQSGDSPLHVAVRDKNYPLCCRLVEEGADVNCLNGKRMTPIMLAAKIGCEELLSRLVQHPDATLDIGNQDNDTALHLAVLNSREDAVRILLEAGANIKAMNDNQFTPFHLAARSGHEKILELCLDKFGQSLVDLQKDDKLTALHLAALNNHTDCLRLLIRRKADLNIRNNSMQTALHIAVSQKYMDCVTILVESRAELDLQDEDGDTPLHDAIRLHNLHKTGGMMGELRFMFMSMGGIHGGSDEPEDIAVYLVEHGASLDILNSAGKSPLTSCEDRMLREKLRNLQTESSRSRMTSPEFAEPESQVESAEQMQVPMQNVQNEILCAICLDNRSNVAFNCGHLACNECANNLNDCHICRQRIEIRIQIFT